MDPDANDAINILSPPHRGLQLGFDRDNHLRGLQRGRRAYFTGSPIRVHSSAR